MVFLDAYALSDGNLDIDIGLMRHNPSDVFLRQIVALDDGLDGARHVENGMLIHRTAFLIDEMFAGIYGLVARHLGRTACCHMERLVAFAINTVITIHKANLLRRSFHHDASSAIAEDRT